MSLACMTWLRKATYSDPSERTGEFVGHGGITVEITDVNLKTQRAPQRPLMVVEMEPVGSESRPAPTKASICRQGE